MRATAGKSTSGRRPDDSMTLLTEVMQRPLDPGYAAAAARATESGAPRRRAPLTSLLAVAAGVLLVVAVLDLRLPGALDDRDVLSTQIRARTAEADALETLVERVRSDIDGIQAEALAGTSGAVLGTAERLGVVTGATGVSGPGVEIVLNDASTAPDAVGDDVREDAENDDGRVVDRDIVVVTNGLWASGAEAVAVNGQRLTSLAAIRSAGDAILVGFRPLAPPYRIVAVGDAQDLQTGFASSAAGRYLATIQQNYGVRATVSGRSLVELPGSAGLQLRYAELADPPQEGVTVPSSSPPSSSPPSSSPPSSSPPSSTGTP